MINKSLKKLNTEVLKSALVEYAENQPEGENVTRSELEGILLEVFKILEKNNCAGCLEVKEKLASKYNLR